MGGKNKIQYNINSSTSKQLLQFISSSLSAAVCTKFIQIARPPNNYLINPRDTQTNKQTKNKQTKKNKERESQREREREREREALALNSVRDGPKSVCVWRAHFCICSVRSADAPYNRQKPPKDPTEREQHDRDPCSWLTEHHHQQIPAQVASPLGDQNRFGMNWFQFFNGTLLAARQ